MIINHKKTCILQLLFQLQRIKCYFKTYQSGFILEFKPKISKTTVKEPQRFMKFYFQNKYNMGSMNINVNQERVELRFMALESDLGLNSDSAYH